MAGMLSVTVPIVQVVGVVTVSHGLVSASSAVRVLTGLRTLAVAAALAFIPVSLMLSVSLAIMHVVSMGFVLRRGVAAGGAVLVTRVLHASGVGALNHGGSLIMWRWRSERHQDSVGTTF